MAMVRWRKYQSNSFGAKAAGTATGKFEPPDAPVRVVLTGWCPRCNHQTPNTELIRVPAPSAEEHVELGVRRQVEPIKGTVALDCACTVSHPGRPRKVTSGCGARWALLVSGPKDQAGTAVIKAGKLETAPTAEDEAAAGAIANEELVSARKTAQDWRTGLLLLAGLVTTFTVAKGTESVTKLSDPLPWLLAGVSLLAIGLAIAGALLSLRASFGMPGETLEVHRGFAQDIRDWKQDEATRSSERIWQATRASVLSVALLIAAVGITWFGGTKPAAYLRVGTSPQAVCGKLTESNETSLTVTDAANVKHAVSMSKVVSLEVVDSCP